MSGKPLKKRGDVSQNLVNQKKKFKQNQMKKKVQSERQFSHTATEQIDNFSKSYLKLQTKTILFHHI